VTIQRPDWLRATPFGFANMAVMFSLGMMLVIFFLLNRLDPSHWIWLGLLSLIPAGLLGYLMKLSDCPSCGKSPFRYGSRWGKCQFGRLYKAWLDRECSECGRHLDRND
jgi:hypothetical protein